MADVREAGQALRRLREERGWTQRDVERLSGGELFAQQVSRLETGALSKPPMEDLILLGRLYGLSPSEMAHLYGYDGEATRAGTGDYAVGRAHGEPFEPERAPETEGETAHSIRSRSERPSPEQLDALSRRRAEEEQEQETFSARLRELSALESSLPSPLRRRLAHWLELIIALLRDELRASS